MSWAWSSESESLASVRTRLGVGRRAWCGCDGQERSVERGGRPQDFGRKLEEEKRVGSGRVVIPGNEGVGAEVEPSGRPPQVHGQTGECGRGQAEHGAEGAPIGVIRGCNLAVRNSVGCEGDEEVVDGAYVLHFGGPGSGHGRHASALETVKGRKEGSSRVQI